MVSRILTSLADRRKQLTEKEKGFTLIELLVVVIIIGILAAIAIPVYLGVQDSAKDSGTKSDLANAKIAVVGYMTDNSGAKYEDAATGAIVPTSATLSADSKKFGATFSDSTAALTYKGTAAVGAVPGSFCIAGKSKSSGSSVFFLTDTAGVQKVSTAAPVVALPATCTAP